MCMSGEGGGWGMHEKWTFFLYVRETEIAKERKNKHAKENKHARGREGGRAVSEKEKDSVSVVIYLRVSVWHVFHFRMRMCFSVHTHCVCIDTFFDFLRSVLINLRISRLQWNCDTPSAPSICFHHRLKKLTYSLKS